MRQICRAAAIYALAALALAACSPEAETPPAPVTPSPLPVGTPAPAVSYACESGQSATVVFPDTATALLTYKGRSYTLRIVQSASGARYVGSGLEWWSAARGGSENATLSRLGPNEDVGETVLERCSRPTSGPVAPGPHPGPQPAPGNVLPTLAPCRGPQLKLSADGGDAGAGNRVLILGVQNVGIRPCSLTGFPTVVLQDGRGRNLTAVRADQTPGSYFRSGQVSTPVELAPKGKAFFDIAWNLVPNEGNGETACPSAERIRMTAPGDTSPVSLAEAFTPCGGRIRVSPFRPAAEPVPEPAPATTS
jgi:membrane-bound inhibitor of C-type lysozyme